MITEGDETCIGVLKTKLGYEECLGSCAATKTITPSNAIKGVVFSTNFKSQVSMIFLIGLVMLYSWFNFYWLFFFKIYKIDKFKFKQYKHKHFY